MATIKWYEDATAEIISLIDSLPDWMRGRIQTVWKRDGAEVLRELCRMLTEAPTGPRSVIMFIKYPPHEDNVLVVKVTRLGLLCGQIVDELRADQEEARTAYREMAVRHG